MTFNLNLSELIFEDINSDYGRGNYGTISVIIRKKDGYINATKLCKDAGKELFNWNKNNMSNELMEELEQVLRIRRTSLMEVYQSGTIRELSGTYAHPKLIPHIASWSSVKFAVTVSEIVNNFLVREYKETIRAKDTHIDELIQEVKETRHSLQEARQEIRFQTSTIEKQSRLLEVMNENVIESVTALHHVSDQSVPLKRWPEPLTEQLVIVHTCENRYETIRAQTKYVNTKLKKLRCTYPDMRVVVHLNLRPNSRELWIAVKNELEEGGVDISGMKFKLERDQEEWLIHVLNKCNSEKFEELLATKEHVRERLADVENTVTSRDLLQMTLPELKNVCRENNLKGWSKLKKVDLVNFIINSN